MGHYSVVNAKGECGAVERSKTAPTQLAPFHYLSATSELIELCEQAGLHHEKRRELDALHESIVAIAILVITR